MVQVSCDKAVSSASYYADELWPERYRPSLPPHAVMTAEPHTPISLWGLARTRFLLSASPRILEAARRLQRSGQASA